jgi:diketogulonate reductase-like aldo/keto reductase
MELEMHTVNANGAIMPALGFGTYELQGKTAADMVEAALGIGYRHIDTAQAYDNEEAVGVGIAASGLPREEIFLTTKVSPSRFRPNELQRSLDESLARLETPYVDLLLLHWPNPDMPLKDTMAALNDMRRIGRARHIGVSNFPSAMVDEAIRFSDEPLAVDQVEYHPLLAQGRLLNALHGHGMGLTAYSPLAQGRVFNDETLTGIGQAHGKTAGQVALRWLIQQDGVCAIPRSSSIDHARSNFDIFDFELSPDEMRKIHKLSLGRRRLVDPEDSPDWD